MHNCKHPVYLNRLRSKYINKEKVLHYEEEIQITENQPKDVRVMSVFHLGTHTI